MKSKARRIHFEQEMTGGGIFIIETLTNLEKKLLEVLTKILIFGHPSIIELGFKTNKKSAPKCRYTVKRQRKYKGKTEFLYLSTYIINYL